MIYVPSPSGLLLKERELEKLVTSPLDLDYEAWRATRYAFLAHKGRVLKLPRIGGGSFVTGTQSEIIYSNQNAGTAKNTFTTEAQINDTTGMGTQAKIPSAVWYANTTRTATIRFTARGIVSSTSAPTYTFTTRFVSTGGVIICGSATLTAATTISNKLWEMEWDTQIVTMAGAGNNSTIRSAGLMTSPAGFTTVNNEIWGNASQPGTAATVDVTIDNLIFFDVACGTSNASNGVTLLQLIVAGLN